MLSFNKLVGKFLFEKQRWKARFRKARENETLLFKGRQFGTRGYQGVVKKSQYNDKGNEKNSLLKNFKIFKALVENGREKISTLRIDKRGEYMSHEFSSFLGKHGIHKLFITIDSPH